MWTPGARSSKRVKGGEAKWVSMVPAELMIWAAASGWGRATVRRSSWAKFSGPNSFCGGHLEGEGGVADLDGGEGDLVLVGEVPDGVDVGVPGVEGGGHDGGAHDGADGVGGGAGLVPEEEHGGDGADAEGQLAREEAVIRGGAAGEDGPVHLEALEAQGFGVFLDEVVVFHDEEGEEGDAELAGEGNGLDVGFCGGG